MSIMAVHLHIFERAYSQHLHYVDYEKRNRPPPMPIDDGPQSSLRAHTVCRCGASQGVPEPPQRGEPRRLDSRFSFLSSLVRSFIHFWLSMSRLNCLRKSKALAKAMSTPKERQGKARQGKACRNRLHAETRRPRPENSEVLHAMLKAGTE